MCFCVQQRVRVWQWVHGSLSGSMAVAVSICETSVALQATFVSSSHTRTHAIAEPARTQARFTGVHKHLQ
jgi:hypothetical protein